MHFSLRQNFQPRALPKNSYPGTTQREIKIYNIRPQANAILSTTPVLPAILRGTEEGVHDTVETHTSLRARARIPLSHSHSKPESLQEEEVSVHPSVTTLNVQFGGKNACHARVRA